MEKRFILLNELIKFDSPVKGWIKRSDIVPANVLTNTLAHEKDIMTYYLSEKCKDLLSKADGKKVFDHFEEKKEVVFRNAQVALCSITNQDECKNKIEKIKKEIDDLRCK